MLRNRLKPLPLFASGFASPLIQCLLLREFLATISNNEIILGIFFAVWLLFSGLGSYVGNRFGPYNIRRFVLLFCIASIGGLYSIRLSPALFDPGVTIAPLMLVLLFMVAVFGVSFLTGYIFGITSRHYTPKRFPIYLYENFGSLLGAVLAYWLTILEAANILFLLCACWALLLCYLLFYWNRSARYYLQVGLLLCAAIIGTFVLNAQDFVTASIKYAGPVKKIIYSREGEIGFIAENRDTTLLLNNVLYRSSLDKQWIEQAIHIPAAQREHLSRVLVVFNRGHAQELTKYPHVATEYIETLPHFVDRRSTIVAPEQFAAEFTYDIIYCGASLPHTIASSRFYTKTFFKKMKELLTSQGVLTFTLPFTESYMPPKEERVYNTLGATMKAVFPRVLVFPGNGVTTFMGSNYPLHIPDTIAIENDFVNSQILPAITEEKIKQANTFSDKAPCNTKMRPIILLFALQHWMKVYGYSTLIFIGLMALVFILWLWLLPKKNTLLSVFSSGLVTGVFSVGVIVLYQGNYGSLYAEITLLLVALNAGFVAGSFCKAFPHSDLWIALFCVAVLSGLAYYSSPPKILFLLCNGGIGFLSAAQFVTRTKVSYALLNSADLVGGVFGMALSATIILPMAGIIPACVGMFVIKIVVGLIVQLAGQRVSHSS